MPDLSLPEVRLRERLPEGLRDMTMDDIQKALPEFRLPDIDLGSESRKAGKAAGKAADKAAREASKAADKAVGAASKQAGRMARDARSGIESRLPRRGPNPVPIAVLAMVGGAVVGWILANNATTGPRIAGWLDDLRMRFDAWRSRSLDELEDQLEPGESIAFPASEREPIAADPWSDTLPEAERGVSVGPGRLPEGMGAERGS